MQAPAKLPTACTRRTPTRRVAAGITWAFVVCTTLALALAVGKLLSDQSDQVRIMAGSTMWQPVESVGLTFHGRPGAVLAAVEAALTVSSLLVGALGRGLPRRLARIAVVAWASLWLFNAARLAVLTEERQWWGVAAGATLALTAAAAWAAEPRVQPPTAA